MGNTPLRVLVVDDDPDTRENLRDILEMDGYVVEGTGLAGEVVARGDLAGFFAILLDRRLPDRNGEEILPWIRQVAPQTAILIVTGYGDLEGAVAALRHGVADYILKPVNPDALRLALARIAERRRLAREKERSEAAFQTVVEAAECMIVILRADHTLAYFNPFAEEVTGYRAAEVLGKDYFSLFLPEAHQPGVAGDIRRLLEGGDPTRGYENPIRCKDGSERWMVWTARCLADYEGERVVLAMGYDITQRRRVEQALKRSEEELRLITDNVSALIAYVDAEGRYRFVNRRYEETFALGRSEIVGKSFTEFLGGEGVESLAGSVQRVLAGQVVRFHSHFPRLGHGPRWAIVTLVPDEDEDGGVRGFFASINDISDLKEAQDRALRAERLAAVGEAMAALAHESRNALQRSQACLEMLAKYVQDRPKAVDLVERIQKAQDRLDHLYEEVRAYASPIQLQREPFDLRQVVEECWEDLGVQRGGRRTRLEHAGNAIETHVEADRRRIEQVFRNIFENSLAACADPVEIRVHWSPSQWEGQPALRIAVRDNGPGLSPEARLRIFDSFFTTKTHGTGLGMAISRRIVEIHGGTIAVGDHPGPGAEIVITLPRTPKRTEPM